LRAGLLRGVRVVLAGVAAEPDAAGAMGGAVESALTALGAHVHRLELIDERHALAEDQVEHSVEAALGDGDRIDMLIVDGAGVFAGAGGARDGLRVCLEAAWNVTRAVANAALIPSQQGGRIAYVAPAAGAGGHATACCAGLENLARTLSIEWARYGITPVAIAPGDRTETSEVATLAAYLASPAGAYFSGCLLDLRGPAPV
jgi:NAD(P)-dependent dehydrogenase (short-subunit alcohol dehydrogenase family)